MTASTLARALKFFVSETKKRSFWKQRPKNCLLPGYTDGIDTTSLGRMDPERFAALLAEPAKAAPYVELLARNGVTAAQLRLGRMLLEGTGVPQDRAAAFRWFTTAARDGDVEAMNMTGRCHENGWGTQQDMAQAAVWFARAATRGDSWAQYNLGHCYLDGLGVARDQATAFIWYSRAASAGHARALNLVGRCHEEGWGTPRDPQAAMAAYQASAQAGYFRGQYNYGSMLLARGLVAEGMSWLARAKAAPKAVP